MNAFGVLSNVINKYLKRISKRKEMGHVRFCATTTEVSGTFCENAAGICRQPHSPKEKPNQFFLFSSPGGFHAWCVKAYIQYCESRAFGVPPPFFFSSVVVLAASPCAFYQIAAARKRRCRNSLVCV